MKTIILLALSLFVQFISFNAEAQNPTKQLEKKEVRRTIFIADDTVKVKTDSTFSQMLINDVRSGQLTAYHYSESGETEKLPLSFFLTHKGASTRDSLYFINPTTGQEIVRARKTESYIFPKLRLIEEWSLNPKTGRNDIEIVGIGPLRDIYGDDWKGDDDPTDYRGEFLLFWVNYHEAKKTIARYDKLHPLKTITKQIQDESSGSDTPIEK